MNICFETFGCRLNRAEALENEARCLALGHKIVTKHAEADLFVVRGCSVTARAQRECEQMIRHLRHRYPNKRTITMGCLRGATKTLELSASSRLGPITAAAASAVPQRTSRAYLKVQDGCAGNCAFCIVPKFRGSSASEPFGAILEKAGRFIAAGYHELVVTGCNLALYASEGKRLPELLDALAGLDPACRIRLGSLEPWGCADEVVDVIAENENVCRFLHLPVQSGSDRILKLMNRPYAMSDVERIVDKAMTRMPFVALGCDMMTGFPGEGLGEFDASRKLLARVPFSNVHVFPYSERPDTPAVKLHGLIQKHVRSERAHTLSAIAKVSRQRFAKRFVGREVSVVIESHGTQPKGWTGEYLWFEGPLRPTAAEKNDWKRKSLLRFTVKSADKDILRGTAADNGR